MTSTVDALVDRYLTDLEAELRFLPGHRRGEILDEVGEHITQARAVLDADSEVAIRTMLERLGDPADIAAEARERLGLQARSPATPRLEILALIALVIPFLGWLVGVVLVWLSRLWTTRDKLIGTLGGLSWVVAGLGTIATSAGRSDTPVGTPPTMETTGPGAIQIILFVAPSCCRSLPPSTWGSGCAPAPTPCPPLADRRSTATSLKPAASPHGSKGTNLLVTA